MDLQYLISALRTKRTKYGIHSSIILILLIVHHMNSVSLQTVTFKPIRNMETIEFNSEPLFRVIVNRDNNEIIVGARNAIYKLSPNDLQKNDEFITGPVNDSLNCLPPPLACETDKPSVNNDNQILLIKYDNKDFPLLFACGDAYQGMCYVLKATNLSYTRTWGSPNDTLSFVGSKKSSVAFFGPSSSSPKSDVLYVAHAYDGRPIEFSPPTISSRKMNGFKGFTLAHNSGTAYTKVDFHPRYKQTYNVKYLYGFNYSSYSYFLSTQHINARDTQEYETKLIRICQNDNQFFSYMEIPLICSEDDKNITSNSGHNKNKNPIYYIASTAYFGKIGSNKFRELDIRDESNSHTLFISFGVQTMGSTFNKSMGSAICAFSMKKINKAFTDAAKECIRGGTEVSGLEVIFGVKRECQKIEAEVNDDFCGTGLNPHIGSNRPLNGLFLNTIRGHVTSLAVAIQGSKSVAAIGTEDGRIMKVLLDDRSAADKPLFEMNLSGQSTDRSIRPNPAFDNQNKYLYLLSGNQLVKFPFGSCSLHTDCSSCLDPSDPLRCGWCDTYCATEEECHNPLLMSKSMCPPEVFEFSPKSGPLLGGTIVTISGDNLGRLHQSPENSHIKITIAGAECEVIDWQPRRVQCRTNPVEKEVSGFIEVHVEDVTGGRDRHYDINGTVKSQEEFKYLEPQLLGVNPSFGPYAGGTNVTIVGKNLHIGSKRNIYLAGIECKEIDNNSTFVSCVSGPYVNKSEDTSVRVVIDTQQMIVNQNTTIQEPNSKLHGMIEKNENSDTLYEWTEFYVYKPDPIILSFEPKSTIKSGNTNIKVIGNNLNSVKNPRMQILAISRITREEIRTQTSCEVNEFGTKMICKTPPLSDSMKAPNIKVPIETQISFIMDGVKNLGLTQEMSRLIYFPDPTYFPFSENENIRIVHLEEPILKIDGKDLTADYPIVINISGKVPCNLIDSKTFDAIHCVIEYDENIFKVDDRAHVVDIRVGKIHFSPGKIKFAPKPSNVSVGVIMVSVLVPILLIAVIAAVITYYLKSRGIILKKYPPFPVHYTADFENGERPPYSSQHSHNNYVRGDVTHPLLPVEGAVGGHRYQVTEEQMALLRAEHILIERSNIALEDVIGQGHFGCVYRGKLYSPEKEIEREVAVKTLHSSTIREDADTESFLQEGLMMKDFKHHHVLTLIGVCFEEDGSPIVVLPFMQNGDLLSYIREETNMPTVKNLLTFAIEIAQGMDYLSSQKFVHRDLAARNCMLDSDLCVKVADFGLSRDIYERDYYSSDNKKCKLPVKWMSPESLEKGTYNTKTDVWSYGVLVWELMTRGVTPYPDVDNWEILNFLKQGRRMPRPSYCPELLYFILLRCWSEDPKSRPTFTELCDEVQGVITKLEKCAKTQKVGLDVTYVNYPLPNTYANDSQIDIELSNKQKVSQYETTC